MKKEKLIIIILSVIAVVAISLASVLFYQKNQEELEQQMMQEKTNEVEMMLEKFYNESDQIKQIAIMNTTEKMRTDNIENEEELTFVYESVLIDMEAYFDDYIIESIETYTFTELSKTKKEELNSAIEKLKSIKSLDVYVKVNSEEKAYNEKIDLLIDSYQMRIEEIAVEEAEEVRIAEEAAENTRIAEEAAENARIVREAEYDNKIVDNKVAEGTEEALTYSVAIESYNSLLTEIIEDQVITQGTKDMLTEEINVLIVEYTSERDRLINIGRMNAMAISQ